MSDAQSAIAEAVAPVTAALTTPAPEAAAPATPQPAPVPAAAPVTPAEPAEMTDSQRQAASDAAEDAWLAKQPAGETDAHSTPAATPAGENAPPVTAPVADPLGKLTDAEKANLVKRFHLDPVEADVVFNLKPESREKFLANLAKRQEYTDNVTAELRQLKQPAQQQQEPGQQATQQAPPALPQQQTNGQPFRLNDDVFAPLTEFYGDAGAGPIRSTLETALGHTIGPVAQIVHQQSQQIDAMAQMLAVQQQDQAFNTLKLPAGVNKDDPATRQRLLEAAYAELNGSFDWQKNNWTHAIPKAASQLFNQQAIDAVRQQREDQRKASLRGSPDPGATRPRSQPALDEDDRESAAIAAALAGKGVAGAREAYTSGR